ncbi:MAG: DUF3226 domain-containing protein [Ktedonobacteraceae bacterium]
MGSKLIVRKDSPINYLLVEGKDDEHVMYSLLAHHKIPEKFVVDPVEGVDNLLDAFEVRLTLGEFECLGVIVDADDRLAERWQKILHILKSTGYTNLPDAPDPQGTVIKNRSSQIVGIWMMPDNIVPGKLEDFVSFLRPQDDVLWPVAVDTVQKVKAIETRLRFRDVHESKAQIHTWLAWQEEPGKPMGTAITARYLDANAPHAQLLMAWIRKLFDLGLV